MRRLFNRGLWTVARLVAVVPPILLLLLAIFVVRREFQRSRYELLLALTHEISASLNLSISVKDVNASVPGRLIIRKLALSKKGFGKLLTADRAIVHYNLISLLRDYTSPASTIGSISVIRPVVYIERSHKGTINFTEAFKPKPGAKKKTRFQGTVLIRKGAARYIDHKLLSKAGAPLTVLAHGIDGIIDLRSLRGANFNASVAQTSLGARVKIDGAYGNKGRFAVRGEGSNLVLSALDAFLPSKDIRLLGGKADGCFLVTRLPGAKGKMHFWLAGNVKRGALKLPGKLPIVTEVNGQVSLAGADLLKLDCTAQSVGTAWRAKGVILSLAKPDLWLDLASKSADYDRLSGLVSPETRRRGISVKGRGPLRLSIRGPLNKMSVTGQTAIPRVSYQGRTASDIRAKFSYEDGHLALPAVSAVYGQGRAAGFGTLDIRPVVRASGRLRFSDVSLAKVDPRIAGRAWGSAEFSLVNGRQLGRVSFQVSGPRAFGRRASSAAGRLRVDGGKVYLDSVLISTPDGYATASGMVTTAGIIDLDVSGVGLTAQDLTGPSKSSLTAGILNADGTVTGSFGNPVFTGRIQALDAVWAGRGIDEINGTITASRDSVSTTGLTVAKSASEAIITGTINNPLSDARSLDIAADVKSVDLTDVAKALPALDGVSGRMSGRVSSIQGRLDSLKASFALTVEEGRYHAYSAPLISVKGDYDQGDVNLESLSVKRGTANLTAQGAMSRTGALDFSFAVSDFPFDDSLLLALNRSIPVSGMLDASGHLTGTRESPTLEATLSGKDLNAAGEQLALTDSTVVLTQNVLTVTGASLTVGGGPLTVDNIRISTAGDDIGLISAAITIGSGGADSTGRVDVARLLAMVRGLGIVTDMIDPRWRPTALQLPEHIQGKLSGTVTVGTSPGGYLTSANLQVTGLQTWGANLGTVTLAASTGPQGTIVDTLTLEDNDMLVTAKGRLDANGALTADVEGNNVDVVRIPAVQAFQSASGRVDFSFEAKGTLTDPLVEGSILARDAEISGVRIDRFSTGQITATKDSITIAESTVGSGANRIRFAGSLPFSITRMAFVDGGAMDVHAEAINPNLDVLALLTNRINIDRTEGDGQAELNVTGTWPTPQLEGFIRVADGRVAIKGMQTEFEKVKVDIGFDGQRINIQEFSAESSHGGKLSITGGAKMGDQGWSADMAARTENMGIRLRNVSEVYQETFNGEMDLDLGVSGPLMKPLIAGKIVAHTGSLGLPTIPKTMTPHKPVAFDPSFDIALVAGKDLKARSPRLNVDIAGQIQLAQSLNNPLVTGQLQVVSGYMLLPGSRFRVVPIGMITFRYDQSTETRVTMDIRAETELTSSASSLGFGGQTYRVEMHARGSFDDPKVSFQSYPPGLESGSIFAMLGQRAGVGPSGFSSQQSVEREVAQLFTANIVPGVLQPVEFALADALGLQEVAFGFGQYEPVNITLRRRLFGSVSVQYWRALGGGGVVGQQEEEWKLLYDLTHRLRLSYGESRFGINSAAVEGSINF